MPRYLSAKEHSLITLLLTGTPYADRVLPSLPSQLVTELADGGMGSLLFDNPDVAADRYYGNRIAELQLKDQDEVPVVVTLIVDQQDQLYELDVWKVDFSPTIDLQLPS
jgi:hypothetical protein